MLLYKDLLYLSIKWQRSFEENAETYFLRVFFKVSKMYQVVSIRFARLLLTRVLV